MRPRQDPLYLIFEHHLLNCIVENEPSDDFVQRVVSEYVQVLNRDNRIPPDQLPLIEADLHDEVVEMMRKRTYGHYSLADFRRQQKKNTDVAGTRPAAALNNSPANSSNPAARKGRTPARRRSC